jgi:hypothetical protein
MKWKIGKHRNSPPGRLAPIHNWGKGDPPEWGKCLKKSILWIFALYESAGLPVKTVYVRIFCF